MKKIFSILMCMLMISLSFSVIEPFNIKVKAADNDPPSGGDTKLDFQYIKYITEKLSYVISDPIIPWKYGIPKGRAFGTEGEWFAVNEIIKKQMENNLSLWNVTIEKMQNISKPPFYYFTDGNLTHKLEVLSQEMKISYKDNSTDDVIDLYINPRWNDSKSLFSQDEDFDFSILTHNFTHNGLKVVCLPNMLWLDEDIDDIYAGLTDGLSDIELAENFTLNDPVSFFNIVIDNLEQKYDFSFDNFEELGFDNESLPWYNATIANLTEPYVFIYEDPDIFNPDCYFGVMSKVHYKNPLMPIPIWIPRLKLQYFLDLMYALPESLCMGLILYDHNNNTYNMGSKTTPVPVLYINRSQGKAIFDDINNYTIDFHINQSYNETANSSNVFGQINGTNPDKTIIISSYYDSWWCQGVVDGAIPMSTVLAIAKFINETNITPKCNVKIIGFCAEEYGYRGAIYYEQTHQDENILAVIDLNQLGYFQEDPPEKIDLNVATNKLWFLPILNKITGKTRYPDRLDDGTGLKVLYLPLGAPANDFAFARRACDFLEDSEYFRFIPVPLPWREPITFCFLKDTNWTRHHRDGRKDGTGEPHYEGDSMKYFYNEDVNLSGELAWNLTKFIAFNPDCCFEEAPEFNLSDTDGDGENDTINVSYCLNKSWPLNEPVSVRMVLFRKRAKLHPCWPILYRKRFQEDYILTGNAKEGYINTTLPRNFPKGEYIVKLYLCNSTGSILLDAFDDWGINLSLNFLEFVEFCCYLRMMNNMKTRNLIKLMGLTILNEIGWNPFCLIEKAWDLKKMRVRNFLKDFIVNPLSSDDEASETVTLHPPNNPPNKPEGPEDLGLADCGLYHRYRTNATDPDPGDKIRFQWEWNGIRGFPTLWKYNSGQDHIGRHKWISEGEKTVKVRARDPWNPSIYSDWNETTVNISEGSLFHIYTSQTNQSNNNNPNAQNSFDPNLVVVNQNVYFQGDSYGFSGSPTHEYIIQGNQTNGTTANNSFNETGDAFVNFTATLNSTLAYSNRTIKVANISACFNMDQLGAQPYQTINFNDTTISNLTIVNWTWNFGDGNVSYGQNVSHNYTTPGVYNITLNVTDNNSEVANFWQHVPIESDPPGIVDVTHYPIPGTLGCNVTICAEFFDDNESGIYNASVNISYPNGTSNNFTMSENENNSFGYEFVFNDTMQVGWYYYTIWVTDHANNSNYSAGYGFQILPAFGYSTIGILSKNIKDNISGSKFTVLANGTAENISAYLHANLTVPPRTHCLIYRVNDSTLIGTTEEKKLNTGDEPRWVNYNFTGSKPNLTTNTQYVIVCWSDDTCNLSYDNATNDSHGRYMNCSYNNTPQNLNGFSSEPRLYSIYCNYSTIPEVKNVSAFPDPIGYGFNTTITAKIEHYHTLVDNITVNITYTNSTTVNYSMERVDDDTFQYTFDDSWILGQYNYSIWVKDKLGANCTSSGHSFNVSTQASISVSTVKNEYGDNETINITDPPGDPSLIGYELLDDGDALHMWNPYNHYYFNTSSGIQLTNHYNEYWSHNVLMLGYYNNDVWNLIYRTDEQSGFTKDIDTDNETYVNATLWKDLTYQGYAFRLAIRYHLGIDDWDLTVIPYIKNLGIEIPYNLGFGWEIKDIKIADTYENDWIRLYNGTNWTSYKLDQTLDNQYTDMDYNTSFYLEGRNEGKYFKRTLYLKWNHTLDYLVKVKNRTGQHNAPVTLFIKIGTLGEGQKKYTMMHWLDSDDWLGIGSNELATACEDKFILKGALDGQDMWSPITDHEHEFILDLGQNYRISKARGRSESTLDPTDVDIYISTDNSTWGTAVASDISTWQDTFTWVEINTTCELGRYIKVVIQATEDETRRLVWGLDPPDTIFDLYGEEVLPIPPEVSNPSPVNGSIGISIVPMLNITVSDSDGDTMNITWSSNSSGGWEVFGTNSSVGNGTYHQTFTNASVNGQWWYWRVNVTDEENYTESDVYKFYTGYQSKINNTGSTTFKGYLLIQVQYYNTTNSTWVVADDTINETSPRIVYNEEPDSQNPHILALDTIFNGLVNTSDLSSYGNGTYRIYAAFRDPDGNILVCDDETELVATYEFEITFE